ncbi:DUF1513 domain-containing protein [Nisaea sp.]|uniref:DUF1513 domain-containing protein n=1 Tax=Nisaea sp. TaxID=2024842 RepID=UPI003B525B90
MMTRRNFLAGITASGVTAPIASPLTAGSGSDGLLISAARRKDGSFVLVGCTGSGEISFQLPLPGRGHATTLSPDAKTAVHVARRPGRFMLVVDLGTGTLSAFVSAPGDRHFYGHAEFSADGKLLFTTENDFDRGRGVIGIWDCRDGYRRAGEWDSHGAGPHDLALLPGGAAMAIANGGILTHPDSGRAKLNIADMQPNLTFLDARDGSVIRKIALPGEWHKNSIRHLDTGPDGSVLFGMQFQGARTDVPPLVGHVGTDGALSLFDTPETLSPQLRGYCADVAIDASGRFGAGTFPRGNRIAIWSIPEGRLIMLDTVRDSAGIAKDGHPGAFRFSTGSGRLLSRVAEPDGTVFNGDIRRFTGLGFDNHMILADRHT